jgi:hypothetical protein
MGVCSSSNKRQIRIAHPFDTDRHFCVYPDCFRTFSSNVQLDIHIRNNHSYLSMMRLHTEETIMRHMLDECDILYKEQDIICYRKFYKIKNKVIYNGCRNVYLLNHPNFVLLLFICNRQTFSNGIDYFVAIVKLIQSKLMSLKGGSGYSPKIYWVLFSCRGEVDYNDGFTPVVDYSSQFRHAVLKETLRIMFAPAFRPVKNMSIKCIFFDTRPNGLPIFSFHRKIPEYIRGCFI